MQKVEFFISVNQVELAVGSHDVEASHFQVQFSRKAHTISSQTAMFKADSQPNFGTMRLVCKLHVARNGFLEKSWQLALLRTMPPLTAGKKWCV